MRALEAVQPQAREVAARARCGIIVVDNGSTDGSPEAIRERFPSVDLVRLKSNRGFTGGVEAGVGRSAADAVILLNNDAVPEKGWLASHIRALHDAPAGVIAIGGRILDPTGSRVDFVGGLLTFDGHAFQRDFRKPISKSTPPRDSSEILFACGGNMIVRRREFVELGGFDPDFFAYLEDVDFGWRAWLSGYRCLYNGSATVRHKSSATSVHLGAYERGVLFEKNAIQTAIKNYDDEMFVRFSGQIFLTMLHRLHRYVTDRNRETLALRRAPIGDATPPRPTHVPGGLRRLSRLRRVLGGKIAARPGAVVIDDPLTMMQFRATEWFFRNEARLMEKRFEVQSRRRVFDREIFSRFPLYYVPTYPGDDLLFASPLFDALRPPVPAVEKRLDEIMSL